MKEEIQPERQVDLNMKQVICFLASHSSLDQMSLLRYPLIAIHVHASRHPATSPTPEKRENNGGNGEISEDLPNLKNLIDRAMKRTLPLLHINLGTQNDQTKTRDYL